ncbi:23S rRNA pseudouridine1911/1915/1917 synthase [Virgibacillus halotolerans]|uniref:RluA family pseudouridine synthase n=1 Tax=Virgibacillus halotolerans TaxID=1071053 RepID=UPI00195FC391|nr:RluA family pseudouridine synthase [Virgibacillus halotolerans]MBM7601615.1 23S rRNA pseudouridine1911/1915/1917 synthase [Virgibacillus halotolerans]
MKWVIEKKHTGMLVREYLKEIHGFSRRIIKAVKFDGGKIMVNGVSRTVRYDLAEGDMLQVLFPPEKIGPGMVPEAMDLNIIFEDEDVIVIDKPSGIATIPSCHHPSGTIANGVLAHYEKNNIPYTIHVVSRLDRDTSGLVLIAKHRYSHSLLADLLQAGKVSRTYQAIVEGTMDKVEGVIDAPIDRKEGSIIERAVCDTGKRAITHYQVLRQFQHYSLVEIKLETGRTHQIRVHFSHVGHPLAGDDLYGGSKSLITRQALHCSELVFQHPTSDKMIRLQSQLPSDILGMV